MESLDDEAQRWRAWAHDTAKRIHGTAVAADKLGGGQWDALLTQAGVQPLPADQRAALAHKGPPRKAGPPPIEVRRALEAMAREVGHGCKALEDRASAQDLDLDAQLTRIRLEADAMVADGLRAYLAAVRPKISTSSIFANAAATRTRHLDPSVGPSVQAEVCKCCGAPASTETRDRICVYCGTGL